MKKITVLTNFIMLFFVSNGQFSTSIESIRQEFHSLSSRADLIIQPYDSLIHLRNQLEIRLNNEIAIYKDCETAFHDKLLYLIDNGDRRNRKEISAFRNLELEKEELQNEIVFTILEFNNWNTSQSDILSDYYNSRVINEKEKIKTINDELIKYVQKINSLQKKAEATINEYEKCRKECKEQCECEIHYADYQKQISLAEKYMSKYHEVLEDRKEIKNTEQSEYDDYMIMYKDYYSSYQDRRIVMNENIKNIQDEIRRIESGMLRLKPRVHRIVLQEMERDILNYNQKTLDEIRKINEKINTEFGSLTFYNHLKDMQRMADIMVTTLNPEMNFLSVLDIIAGYDDNEIPENSDGKKLKDISLQYGDILDQLKTAIRSYDAIPYFVLNAYPQYSNEVVDKNLDIIDNKLAFTDEPLEFRTRQFLNISELDLSNTNFSLDLIFKGHKNIERLDLSNTEVSSIKYLTDTNIRWLDLSNTKIGREDLEYLKRMKNIEYLDLSDTGLNRKDIHNVCYHLRVKRRNCKTD